MPASDPCDAEILIASATHGSTQLGIVTGWNLEFIEQDVSIRGEGVTGPTCRGVIARDFIVVVDFLVPPPIAPNTLATLTLNSIQADGGTKAYAITTMRSRGYAQAFNRDSPPAQWRQTFVHVGSMATDPMSIT